MDHENFHNTALPVGGARQPVANEARNVGGDIDAAGMVPETENVVGDNGHAVAGQNGSLDGFDVGMFRSRSGHITGDYPGERGSRKGSMAESGRSSSHEQLHYEASADAESGDLDSPSRTEKGPSEQGSRVS